MVNGAVHKDLLTALEWYADQGVTDVVLDEVVDRTKMPILPQVPTKVTGHVSQKKKNSIEKKQGAVLAASKAMSTPAFLGKSDAYDEAVKLARGVSSLEELEEAISEFDGVTIKKTATNIVFSDGNPEADIMLIGEAPGADEDRLGKPFVGVSGQLLDRILACIGVDRNSEEPDKSVYISNVLNWRPPGNRTPSPAEIEVSLPFIERHIQLVKPKFLILCGGVAAKSLLGKGESISRLRKTWHDYIPLTEGVGNLKIPALATYHPSFLLRTPLQKKAVWADMLMLQERRLNQ